MGDLKAEEIIHQPMDQLQGFEYCIDSNPSWGEAIALGFQHYILSLGTAVMIPAILIQMIEGTDLAVRKKAVMALHRFHYKAPAMVTDIISNFKKKCMT